MTKAIICGGRDFLEFDRACSELDAIYYEKELSCVVHGDARGADTIGKIWANDKGIEVRAYPAKWKEFGNRAGPVRNQFMLEQEKPDLVIAMPGGSGTSHMKRIARAAGVEVIEICL